MKTIKKTLKRFFKEDEYKVLAIKGDWGTGKTYYWNKFYKENRNILNKIAYSYVSLFGINDLHELKRQVFSRHVPISEKKIKRQIQNLKRIPSGLKLFKIPYIEKSQSIFEYFEDKFIKDFLICFDDVERKENSISLSALLGFISFLKDNKNCKIILIFNDAKLSDESVSDLKEYREKVIDLEIKYNPTISDNLSLVFEPGLYDEIPAVFQLLKLNNIRIMQRVKWALNYFEEYLGPKFPHIENNFYRKIAILTCIYHSFSDRIGIEEVLSTNYYSMALNRNVEEEKRLSILRDVQYRPDMFDTIIADYLINGHIDENYAKSILEKANESYRKGSIEDELHNIYELYTSNFNITQNQFVDKLFGFIKSNIEDLSLRQAVGSLDFLKKIKPDLEIEDVLDQCIDKYINAGGEFGLNEKHVLRLPCYVEDKLEIKLKNNKQEYSLHELMDKLAGSDSWDSTDIIKLSAYTKDDYYKWMIEAKETKLLRKVERFFDRFGTNEKASAIIKEIEGALRKISEESQLNKFRIENIIGYKLE